MGSKKLLDDISRYDACYVLIERPYMIRGLRVPNLILPVMYFQVRYLFYNVTSAGCAVCFVGWITLVLSPLYDVHHFV